jgi:hypothetical protein
VGKRSRTIDRKKRSSRNFDRDRDRKNDRKKNDRSIGDRNFRSYFDRSQKSRSIARSFFFNITSNRLLKHGKVNFTYIWFRNTKINKICVELN